MNQPTFIKLNFDSINSFVSIDKIAEIRAVDENILSANKNYESEIADVSLYGRNALNEHIFVK